MTTISTGTMRALRVHTWGLPPRLDIVERPKPTASETLVKLEAAAVTHLDLTIAGGDFALTPTLPYIGGVEGAGTVVSSRTFAVGTRVTVRGGATGMTRPGTWAEYVALPDDLVEPVAAGLSAELAATAFDPLTTAYVTLDEVVRLGAWPMPAVRSAHDEVLIVAGAAGAVGSAVAQLALRRQSRVIGLVSRRERLSDLPPGVEPVTLEDEDALARMDRSRPATALIDTWGGPDLAARGHWVRPGGRLAVVGYVRGTSVTLDLPNWIFDDVAVLPVNLIERHESARRCHPHLQDLLVRQELHVAVERFDLDDAPTAFERLRTGRVNGRAVVMFSRSSA